MNKSDFLAQLGNQLSGLSDADLEKSLAYYNEMIDDRIEDGASEEEAVAAVGTPSQAAAQIFAEMPLGKVLKVKSKRLPTWAIVLLAIGSPIWISLIAAAGGVVIGLCAAAFAVVVSVYAVLWSVMISLWAVGVVFAFSPLFGIFCLVVGIANGNFGGGLTLLGAGLTLGGLSVFVLRFCIYCTKGAWVVSKKFFLFLVKTCFRKKEERQ